MVNIAKKNVKCPTCGEVFDRNEVENLHLGNRYYHLSCCSGTEIYRNKIHKYVMNLWGDKYVYFKINAQITNFISSGKFTAEGIYKSLVFFFEIEKGDPTLYPNTIGIVPHVYEKAKNYYLTLEYKEKQKIVLANQLEEQIQKEPEIKVIDTKAPRKQKKLFEIEER